MGLTKGRTVANKRLKTAVLLKDPIVARCIPPTIPFTPTIFTTFLSKYKRVVLKPTIGTGGHGLLLIRQENHSNYSIQYYRRIYHYQTFKQLLKHIQKITSRKDYLMQPGIRLAKINGRPIDYRVKLVKSNNHWVITAMVGRLANQGLFVTNLCQGGTQLSFREGVQRTLGNSSVQPMKKMMRQLTLRSTKLLEKQFPGIRQLGFDFGIDRKGRIWFFEVNTAPH